MIFTNNIFIMKYKISCKLAKFIEKSGKPGVKPSNLKSSKPTLFAINRDTKISMTALSRMANDTIGSRLDTEVLCKLCEYLNIDLSDLIVLEKISK